MADVAARGYAAAACAGSRYCHPGDDHRRRAAAGTETQGQRAARDSALKPATRHVSVCGDPAGRPPQPGFQHRQCPDALTMILRAVTMLLQQLARDPAER